MSEINRELRPVIKDFAVACVTRFGLTHTPTVHNHPHAQLAQTLTFTPTHTTSATCFSLPPHNYHDSKHEFTILFMNKCWIFGDSLRLLLRLLLTRDGLITHYLILRGIKCPIWRAEQSGLNIRGFYSQNITN